MTPADLAELLKTTAAAVLAERGLDAAALPATVTVERPAQSRARRLRHQRGPASRQEGRRQPARARPDGWPKRWSASRRHRRRRGRRARLRQPAPRGVGAGRRRSTTCSPPAAATADSDELAGKSINLEFVSANPTGPDAHRRHPLGRGRRRAGPGADRPGRHGRPRVLLQRRRRPDRPVRPVAGRRGQGRARAGGRLRGRLHRRHRRAGARGGARRAELCPTTSSRRRSGPSAST